MIYNNNKKNNVETNVENGTALKIAMNAKTFRMLSDTLYSDKIKAIIRELSCNAYDAQIVAGTLNTKKTKLFLPTILEPKFKIRDYGTGMSHNMLLANYLIYGESTKDNDNQQIGCFGIGSKSPFAYTDSFVVVSFYNGIKNTYSIYLDDGIPQCVLIDTENTEEENGLYVEFNVEQEDVKKFEEAAKKVFKNFDILPEFNYEINITKDNFDVDKEKYALKYGYNTNPKIEAIQGNISYPVDNTLLNKLHFKTSHILLKCDIGDFGFAPSREAISYDTETINNLNQKLKDIENEYFENIVKDLKESKSLGEYTKKVYNYSKFVEFKEALIKQYDLEYFEDTKIDYLNRYSHLDCKIDGITYQNISKSNRTNKLTLKKNNKYDTIKDYFLYLNYKFVYNDLGRKGNSGLIINHYDDGNKICDTYLLINCDSDKLKELYKKYGYIENLSDVVKYDEEKIKEKRKLLKIKKDFDRINSVSTSDLFELKNTSYWSSNYKLCSINLKDLKETDKYYYILLKRKNNKEICIELFGREYVIESLEALYDLTYKQNVLFIRSTKFKIVKDVLKLKPLDDTIKRTIEKNINLYLKTIRYNKELNNLSMGLKYFINEYIKEFKKSEEIISYNVKLVKLYNRFFKKNRIFDLRKLMKSDLLDFINESLNIKIEEKENSLTLIDKYPMLKFLNDRNFRDEVFKDYILEKSQYELKEKNV